MAGSSKVNSKINRKKATIAIVLAVVAVALVIGVYLWQKGRLKTSADVELALDQQEEQEFNADDEELAIPGNEFRVGDNKVALRSGTLVKLENAPEIYMIYRGTKQHIADADVFSTGLWLKWENVLVLSADQSDYLKLYQNGPEIGWDFLKNLPNGWTLKFDGSPVVYSIVEHKLKPYPSPSVFFTRHNWNEVSIVPASWKFDLPLDKVSFRFRGGNLVKESDSPKVYWVAGAKKFHIDSPAEFQRWGLRWENVITVDPGFLESRNPEANKPMYATGRKTSKITRNFLPKYLWMKNNNPMVYLFLYDNGAKDLQFINPQVFLNRFAWLEISYQHPARQKATPSTSASVSATSSKSPSNSASSSPKNSPSGGWQPVPSSSSTYSPSGGWQPVN